MEENTAFNGSKVGMQAFVNVFERTTTQISIQEMKQMLAEFGIEKWSRKWHDKI